MLNEGADLAEVLRHLEVTESTAGGPRGVGRLQEPVVVPDRAPCQLTRSDRVQRARWISRWISTPPSSQRASTSARVVVAISYET